VQIERALGTAIGEGRPGIQSGTVSTCSFAVPHGGVLSILLRRHAAPAWMAEQEQRMNGAIPYGRFRPVAASGGRSFVLDFDSGGAAICLFRADYYLQVSLFRAGASPTALPKAEMVAKTAVTRLESRPLY
jgi:hypothetical protein